MTRLPVIPDRGTSQVPRNSQIEAAIRNNSSSYTQQLTIARGIATTYGQQITTLREVENKGPTAIVQTGSLITRKYYVPFEKRLLTIQEIVALRKKLVERLQFYRDLSIQLEALVRSGNRNTGTGTGGSTGGTPDGGPTTEFSSTVLYNVSAVKDAYFTPGQSLQNQADTEWSGLGATNRFDNQLYATNTPAKVSEADDLWKSGLASKGMIQTWEPPGKKAADYIDDQGNWAVLADTKSIQKYGFQFLYNPGNISMGYGGVPDVDPSMMSSGTEEYGLSNPSVYKSTINFEVLVNRMFDMKYIGPGGTIKGNLDVKKLWPENSPDSETLKAIYNKGTMYDIEFLLQTMFSYKPIVSQLRGRTSDMGYLGAFPVEMHLGNSLRYVAIIDSINVNHVIFTDQMVPIFSTVSISAKRVPDYQGGAVTDGS